MISTLSKAQFPDTLSHRKKIWNATKVLNWDDFLASPKITEKDVDAISDCELDVVFLEGDGNGYFIPRIIPLFDRMDSWTKTKDTILLKHEQIHFDICELYARILRKKLIELGNITSPNLNDAERIAINTVKEWRNTESLYDIQTNHGKLQSEQDSWNTSIAEKLKLNILYNSGDNNNLILFPK